MQDGASPPEDIKDGASSVHAPPTVAELDDALRQLKRDARIKHVIITVLLLLVIFDLAFMNGGSSQSGASRVAERSSNVNDSRETASGRPPPSAKYVEPQAPGAEALTERHAVGHYEIVEPDPASFPTEDPNLKPWQFRRSRRRQCTGPNGPPIDYDWWTSLPQYDRFKAHHDRMVREFKRIHTAIGKDDLKDGKLALDAVYDLFVELNEKILRPNPVAMPTNEVLACGANFVPFAHAIHAVDAYKSNGIGLLQRATIQGCHECDHSGQRMDAAVYHSIQMGGTRAARDPAFRPQHFFDLGCRDYGGQHHRKRVQGVFHQVKGLPRDYPAGSTAFFESYYPHFDRMNVLAVDAHPRYEAGFGPLQQKRRVGEKEGLGAFAFWPAAAWVHDRGLALQLATEMMSETIFPCDPARAVAGESADCQCVPSFNFTTVLSRYPPGNVTVKIDIEFSEWVVLEHWAREGVFDRVKEIFFECHSLVTLKSRRPLFERPKYFHPFVYDLYERLAGRIDCYLAHDVIRAHGAVSHNWP